MLKFQIATVALFSLLIGVAEANAAEPAAAPAAAAPAASAHHGAHHAKKAHGARAHHHGHAKKAAADVAPTK